MTGFEGAHHTEELYEARQVHHQPQLHGVLTGGARVLARNTTLRATASPLVLEGPIFPLVTNLIPSAQPWGVWEDAKSSPSGYREALPALIQYVSSSVERKLRFQIGDF